MKVALYIFLTLSFCIASQADEKPKPYSVYVFLHDECVISRYYTIPLAELDQKFNTIADFIGVFPNPQVDKARLSQFAEEYNLDFNLVSDPSFELVNRLNATVTPEVMVVNNRSDTIVYTGRIDNAYARVGKKRTIVTQHELHDVLQALTDGVPPNVSSRPAIGCIITQIKSD